jgi:hypothetical protein
MVEEDSPFGKVKQRIPLFKNVLDSAGSIAICEDGVVIRHESGNVMAPFSYVRKIEKRKDLPLGKVEVEVEVFDQMGEKYDFVFKMSEQDLVTLKRSCGK